MHWYREQEDSHTATNLTLATLGFFAAGAGLMYMLDPRRGTFRRHVVRDKAASAYKGTGTGLRRTARHLRNSAQGLVAETKARFRNENLTDYQLGTRVRAKLGRVCSHPSAITIYADGANGIITLVGDVL